MKYERTLYDLHARLMFEKLKNFMNSDREKPPKKKIRGLFRKEPYEWTVFKFFKSKKGKWKFQWIDFVQHEGECLKRLKEWDKIDFEKT